MAMEPPAPLAGDPDLQRRATRVAGIFEILAMVILIVWMVGAIFVLLAGIFVGADSDSFFQGLLSGIFGAVLFVVYGVISWAGVTLLSLVAKYIANRS